MASYIERFFDSIAASWDEGNALPPQSLLERIGIQKGNRVLDVACGSGIITGELAKLSDTDVLGIDISGKMIENAKRKYGGNPNVNFKKADFCEFRCETPYDVIVIYNAFPHFIDVSALKRSLLFNLRQGGKAAIFHSLSRKELHHHHENLSGSISRDLESPGKEASFFAPEFSPLVSDEGDHHFFLLLSKN